MVNGEIADYRRAMADTAMAARALKDFFSMRKAEMRPMTSLRDVDLSGVISPGMTDITGRGVRSELTAMAMDFIRRGKFSETDAEDDAEEDQRA